MNDTLPKYSKVVLEDQILFWMRQSHDSQICCVITLDCRIDEKRLAKAVRLTLDVEPVLGSMFVKGFFRQYWKRCDDLDKMEFCRLVILPDEETDVAMFLSATEPVDLCKGPQVQVFILRSKTDTLCIKINHVVSDGGGIRDYAYLIASIYKKLSEDETYSPKLNVTGSRSLMQISRQFKLADKLKIIRRSLRDLSCFMFPLKYWLSKLPEHDTSGRMFIFRKLDPKLFNAIKAYSIIHKATINDILITALFHAFYGLINTSTDALLRLVMTADLRRYLPNEKAEAICNLSGFIYLDIGRNLGDNFEDTLSRVHKQMNFFKSDYIGLGNFPVSIPVFKLLPLPFALWIHDQMGNIQKKEAMNNGKISLLLTNTGFIDPQKLLFGNSHVLNAFITPPITFPPILAICASTFNQNLNLGTGFCETMISKDAVEELLDKMETELIRCTAGKISEFPCK